MSRDLTKRKLIRNSPVAFRMENSDVNIIPVNKARSYSRVILSGTLSLSTPINGVLLIHFTPIINILILTHVCDSQKMEDRKFYRNETLTIYQP